MRRDIIELLDRDQDYFIYLRENPSWHRELSFNPSSLKLFVEEYAFSFSVRAFLPRPAPPSQGCRPAFCSKRGRGAAPAPS